MEACPLKRAGVINRFKYKIKIILLRQGAQTDR